MHAPQRANRLNVYCMWNVLRNSTIQSYPQMIRLCMEIADVVACKMKILMNIKISCTRNDKIRSSGFRERQIMIGILYIHHQTWSNKKVQFLILNAFSVDPKLFCFFFFFFFCGGQRAHMSQHVRGIFPGIIFSSWLQENGLFICGQCHQLVSESHTSSHRSKCTGFYSLSASQQLNQEV